MIRKLNEFIEELQSKEGCQKTKDAVTCLKGAVSALEGLEDCEVEVSNELPKESHQPLPEAGTVVGGDLGNDQGDSGDGSEDGDSEGNQ